MKFPHLVKFEDAIWSCVICVIITAVTLGAVGILPLLGTLKYTRLEKDLYKMEMNSYSKQLLDKDREIIAIKATHELEKFQLESQIKVMKTMILNEKAENVERAKEVRDSLTTEQAAVLAEAEAAALKVKLEMYSNMGKFPEMPTKEDGE